MQPLARDRSADELGNTVGSGYSASAVDQALKKPRYQTFRYEVHRKVGGAWNIVVPYLTTVQECTIKYKRTGDVKRTASLSILDDGQIDFAQDCIRVYWQLGMPDGNFAEWCMGTFYLSSPALGLTWPRVRKVDAYDALFLLQRDKMTDWLTTPKDAEAITTAINLIHAELPLAGINIPGSGILVAEKDGITNEIDETVLDVANRHLVYGSYERLFADFNGTLTSRVFVRPSDRANEFSFADWGPDPQATVVRRTPSLNIDLFDAFNRWIGYKSAPGEAPLRWVYDLTDPSNPQSQTARGQIITKSQSFNVVDLAALKKATYDMAEADQRLHNSIEFDTMLYPCDHGDMHELVFSRLVGPWATRAVWYESEWEFPCAPNAVMHHVVERALTAVPD